MIRCLGSFASSMVPACGCALPLPGLFRRSNRGWGWDPAFLGPPALTILFYWHPNIAATFYSLFFLWCPLHSTLAIPWLRFLSHVSESSGLAPMETSQPAAPVFMCLWEAKTRTVPRDITMFSCAFGGGRARDGGDEVCATKLCSLSGGWREHLGSWVVENGYEGAYDPS